VYFQSILETVGNTPMIKLNDLSKEAGALILGKLEMFNPTGSLKDRITVKMIEDAEKDGRLKPGGTIIEASSGNTGVSLAMIGTIKGYKVVIVAPDRISVEKVQLLKAYGAEVVIAKGDVPYDSPESYYSVADRVAAETPGSFMPDQYRNRSNPDAHYETTAREIYEQTEGRLEAFVSGVGTGGTTSGIAKYLKEKNEKIRIIAVDAEGSMFSEESRCGEHLVEGLGLEYMTDIVYRDLFDEIVLIKNREAVDMTLRLARKEGLLVGASTGAIACAALKTASERKYTGPIVILVCDTGERYLSKYFSPEWRKKHLGSE
jgi:cystathionine beta-synthase